MDAEKGVPCSQTSQVSNNSNQVQRCGCVKRVWMTIGPLFSTLYYLIDVGSDINVTYSHYKEQQEDEKYSLYFKLTLTILLLPAPVLSIYSAIEYIKEYKRNVNDESQISKWRWVLRILFTLFFLSRITRILAKWLYGIRYMCASIKGDATKADAYREKMDIEARINANLRILEVLIEAGPQLFLQLLIFYNQPRFYNLQEDPSYLVSTITSLASLAWVLATSESLVRSLSPTRKTEQYTFLGQCILFLAHLLSILPRVIIFVMLTDSLKVNKTSLFWMLIMMHVFVCMFMFPIHSSTNESEISRLSFGDSFLMILGAVVSLFSYMHNSDRLDQRLSYWALCIAENVALSLVGFIVNAALPGLGGNLDWTRMNIMHVLHVASVILFVLFHKFRHTLQLIACEDDANRESDPSLKS